MKKTEFILQFMEHGYLLSPDIIASLSNPKDLLLFLQEKIPSPHKTIVITKDIISALNTGESFDLDWNEFEKSRVSFEKNKDTSHYTSFLNILQIHTPEETKTIASTTLIHIQKHETPKQREALRERVTDDHNKHPTITIMKDFTTEPRKVEMKDFVNIFKSRYSQLQKMLQYRQELQNVLSINRILKKTSGEEIAIIGIISDKKVTKAGNILLNLEDPTGVVRAIVGKNDTSLFKIGEDLSLDEVIGVVGNIHGQNIFVKSIVFPEILNTRANERCDEEIYSCFVSDIHVGSHKFLEKEFKRFISWVNGAIGDEKQKHIAKNVKYIFMPGDLVDGIGVFPRQEEYLNITDMREQYKALADLLSTIRKDITLIICPGQHDSIRPAEPQPLLDKDYSSSLWELPNILFVTNPSFLKVHQTDTFQGYTFLLYHGASFHYFIDNVPSLRKNKARDNPSYVLKYLLQRRHLAPSHTSSTYIPTTKEDTLVIDHVPDVFVCGDMHKSDVSHYNGVITINCSCWQSKTDFQEKTGNNPDPCKVPVFSFKDRAVFMLDFSEEKIK